MFLPIGTRNILEHLGTSWNILEHLGTSWNILEHLGTSWNRWRVMVYQSSGVSEIWSELPMGFQHLPTQTFIDSWEDQRGPWWIMNHNFEWDKPRYVPPCWGIQRRLSGFPWRERANRANRASRASCKVPGSQSADGLAAASFLCVSFCIMLCVTIPREKDRITTLRPAEAADAEQSTSVPRAAVLFIGAARAMVWRAVCENIKSRFLEAVTRLGPQHFEIFMTSVKRHCCALKAMSQPCPDGCIFRPFFLTWKGMKRVRLWLIHIDSRFVVQCFKICLQSL